MKKYFNIYLTILLVSCWFIFQKSVISRQKNFQRQVDIGDRYAAMGANIDALKSYDEAFKYSDGRVSNLYHKKFKIYMKEEKLNEAKNTLDAIYRRGVRVEDLAEKYLEKSIKTKDYQRVNTFLEEYSELRTAGIYKDKMKFLLDENKSTYSNIIQQGDKYSLVELNGNRRIINNQDRNIFHYKKGEIKGFDEEKGLITIVENGRNVLLDLEKNTRSILKEGQIKPFNEGTYVLFKDNRQFLLDQLNYPKAQADKIGTFSDGKNYLLKSGQVSVIDKKLNTLIKFQADDVKENSRGQGIIDEKIILITRKKDGDIKRICNINTGKCSKYYDDIDFSKNSFIAVKIRGMWGFIDQNFKEISKPVYENARSFSNDLGVIKIDGKVHLIDKDFNSKNMGIYREILTFNKEGIGFVKKEEGWRQVKLAKRIRK